MTQPNAPRDIAQSRRRFLTQAGAAGIGLAAAGLIAPSPVQADAPNQDALIISAAATAEALATTMYYNIIFSSLFADGLAGNMNDQAYLIAGYEEELNHYNLLVSAGGKALGTKFYFPKGMFGRSKADFQTTVNTLVLLEDAFIAAYLIGVRDLSTPGLRVLAAQIMGVEAEHRALGRVVAADLGFKTVTGLSGVPEPVTMINEDLIGTANNLAYERTFSADFPNGITDVVKALTPFLTGADMGKSVYKFSDAEKAYSGLADVTLDDTTP